MVAFAYLFPGQGSQSPGMGRSLAEAFPESREVFDAADRALGRSISDLCFEGPAEALALTENTQPCMLTADIATLRAIDARGLRPAAAAGHSLGEYAAHVCAGTIAFEEALAAVQDRARFMQEAVAVGEGAMAAILGMGPEHVAAICEKAAEDEVVSPANLNGPAQVVIAGHSGAVERAMTLASEAGARRALLLPVSAPFHCNLMEPAGERLLPVLESMQFLDPSVPVYSNADAAIVMDGPGARDALARQVASPVRWQESVEAMIASGIDTFVEVGPGKVLTGLVRGISKATRTFRIDGPESLEKVAGDLAS